MKLIRAFTIVLATVWLLSCNEGVTDNPRGNLQPTTYLWLVPDSTVGIGVSRQSLHWWGEDPDGVVIGYLFAYAIVTENVSAVPSPDTLRYVWVTRNDTDMVFPLDTLFRKFVVAVRSVDNTFPRLSERSAVRLSPFPFADENDNGVFDGTDERLTDLTGALDPKGAVLSFPIRNTPPSLYLLPNPLDPSLAFKQPDTTYTVATFGWKGTDPDGDNTLASYRIALNDTSDPSAWLTLPLRDSVITLAVPRQRSDAAAGTVTADVYGGQFLGRQSYGQINGLRLDALNTLFVQVKDVAGEYSPAVTIPSGTQHWYVKKPRGRLLLVSDYINNDRPAALSTYLQALAGVPGGEFVQVDRLDIGEGLSADEKIVGKAGPFVPPYVDPALVLTFLLYDYVVWYTDQLPTLSVAQVSLFTYLQNGGKVLFSTTFLNTIDPRGALKDFAPIDSIGSVDLSPTRPPVPPPVNGDTRVPANYILFADSSDPGNIFPQLAFNSSPFIHSVFMRPVYRRSDARYVYHLQADPGNRYIGTPNVAVLDGQRTILFIGLPLHLLNNPVFGNSQGLTALFTKMFTQQFRATQKVNRRLF
jgi:hypothetical protein